jgi:hypothetical protein
MAHRTMPVMALAYDSERLILDKEMLMLHFQFLKEPSHSREHIHAWLLMIKEQYSFFVNWGNYIFFACDHRFLGQEWRCPKNFCRALLCEVFRLVG